MSLTSWAERLGRQTLFGSDVDTRYIPAMAARLARTYRADEEDRIARRADRAAADELRKAQLASLDRARKTEQADKLLEFFLPTVTRTGAMFAIPGDVRAPAELLADLADPAATESAARQAAIARAVAAAAQVDEARRIKKEDAAELLAQTIAAEQRHWNQARAGHQADAQWDRDHPREPTPGREKTLEDFRREARQWATTTGPYGARTLDPVKAEQIARQRYTEYLLARAGVPAVSPQDLLARIIGEATTAAAPSSRPDPLGIR